MDTEHAFGDGGGSHSDTTEVFGCSKQQMDTCHHGGDRHLEGASISKSSTEPATALPEITVTGSEPSATVDLSDADVAAAYEQFIENIVDHEFYCASYSTKEEPHIDGLLHTLADGVRRLDLDFRNCSATFAQVVIEYESSDAQGFP